MSKKNVVSRDTVATGGHNLTGPDVKEPDVKEADVEEPDVKEPDVREPDVKQPDIKEHSVSIAMRDGVRLAADIYLPDGAGPFPVLMERTPDGRRAVSRSEKTAACTRPQTRRQAARWFAGHGYAVVMQDCRGCYGSEGVFSQYINEGEDGYDTLAWLVRQPWCNGQVGTMGLAYGAHAQTALAGLNPPGLAAMFIDSGGFPSTYHSGIRRDGSFDLNHAVRTYRHALLSPATQTDPLRRKALYSQGYYSEFPDIPIAIVGGWYDPYVGTCVANFQGLFSGRMHKARLLMGPWTHGQRSVSYAGDVDFGPDAVLDGNIAHDYAALRLAWFDRHLKPSGRGQADPLSELVTYFVMGGGSGTRNASGRLDHGGRWQRASQWPPPNREPVNYFFHATGALNRQPPHQGQQSLAYRYNPACPVPTIGGAIKPVMTAGGYDQREQARFFGCRNPGQALAERQDVLVFQTERLPQAVEITGSITAHLWISSDQPDTDFTVKLVDVYPPSEDYPDGYALNLSEGIVRMRYRDGWDRQVWMEPDYIYSIQIELSEVSNLFAAGHRIRVDISSSNYPHYDLNTNSAEPEGHATRLCVANNRLYLDKIRPSHILLPVHRQS